MSAMPEFLTKALTGLALIIPAIFLLRWWLTRTHGSPEDWAEERIEELQKRLANGEIDQEAFEQRVREIRES